MTDLPDVRDLLPHRGRFLLIDHLVRLEDTVVEAVGHFSPERVEGHFPGQPVVPGVLMLEGLAQTMLCLHHRISAGSQGTPYLLGFEKARFRAPVIPPAELHYVVTLKDDRFGMIRGSGVVTWQGRRVCTARLSGAILPAQP